MVEGFSVMAEVHVDRSLRARCTVRRQFRLYTYALLADACSEHSSTRNYMEMMLWGAKTCEADVLTGQKQTSYDMTAKNT